jgi:hypothetical protein
MVHNVPRDPKENPMPVQQCWLCGEIAADTPGTEVHHVECPTCGRYAISDRAVAATATLTPPQLGGLAKRARLESAAGGVLEIGAGNYAALALEGSRME